MFAKIAFIASTAFALNTKNLGKDLAKSETKIKTKAKVATS